MKVLDKKHIKLVVSDLDGTLLDKDSNISTENKEAVSALREAGIQMTLATGRMDKMARIFVKELDIKLPIIACNGAVIRDCTTEKIIRQHTLSQDVVKQLVTWLSKNHVDFLAYHADAVYFPKNSVSIDYFHAYNERAEASGVQTIPIYPLQDHYKQGTIDFVKLMVRVPDDDKLSALKQFLLDIDQCEFVQSMHYAFDIMAKNVSKGQALLELADFMKIKPEEIATLGDHDNDISMLDEAGLGIAMANATQAVKNVSHLETTNHDLSGFAHAIYKYILSEKENKA